MYSGKHLMSALSIMLITVTVFSQEADSVSKLTGTIYDEHYKPVPGTHVINMNTRAGAVSDSLGIFTLPVHKGDTLLFSNIAFRATMIPSDRIMIERFVILERTIYPLQEAKVFPWGSSYKDFSDAIINTPAPLTLGESLGLPRQDPDYVPFDMDEARLKSVGFLLTSPISFLYYNLNKREKNRRKLFRLEKNQKKYEIFDAIVSPESLSQVTGLIGNQLLGFMTYLFERMVCDFKCTEINIYLEIYAHWDVYQQLHPE